MYFVKKNNIDMYTNLNIMKIQSLSKYAYFDNAPFAERHPLDISVIECHAYNVMETNIQLNCIWKYRLKIITTYNSMSFEDNVLTAKNEPYLIIKTCKKFSISKKL